jgi:hypothetical protein
MKRYLLAALVGAAALGSQALAADLSQTGAREESNVQVPASTMAAVVPDMTQREIKSEGQIAAEPANIQVPNSVMAEVVPDMDHGPLTSGS